MSDDRQLGIDAIAGAESEQGFYDSSVNKFLDFSHELARQLIRRRPVRKRRQKLIQASGACKYKKLFHLRRIQEN